MASKSFAKVLQRNSWRGTTILVYALLEWILIFLLLVSGLFQFLVTKFASFFGLNPPCLWCSRIDHLIEAKEPGFYRKLICDRHAREISLLGYCLAHKKLADARRMCDGCSFHRNGVYEVPASEEEEKKKWVSCNFVVSANIGSDFYDAKKLISNGKFGVFDDSWVSSRSSCSCCDAPLNQDKMCSQSFFRRTLLNGCAKGTVPPGSAALELCGDSDDPRRSESTDAQLKISELSLGSVAMSDKEHEGFPSDSDDQSHSFTEESDVKTSLSEKDEDINKKSETDGCESSETDTDSESDDDDPSSSSSSSSSSVSEESSSTENDERGIQKSAEQVADGIHHLPTRIEVAVDPDIISLLVQSDVFVDKKTASHDTVTKKLAVPDVIVSEIHTLEENALESSGRGAAELLEADAQKESVPTQAEATEEAVPETVNEDRGLHAQSLRLDSVGMPAKVDCAAGIPASVIDPGEEVPPCLNVSETGVDDSEMEGSGDPERGSDKNRLDKDLKTEMNRLDDDRKADTKGIVAGAVVDVSEVKDICKCQGTVNNEKLDTEKHNEEKTAQVHDDKIVSEVNSYTKPNAEKADKAVTLETSSSIEGIHFPNKRLSIDRKDSGLESLDRRDSVVESLDGSVLSDIDGESAVDRLKRALASERKALNSLYTELEAERSAAATAANETMAMITRLQEEKAAVQMEALQYQRMMEEQAEYDQEALQLLNEVLLKREREKQDLEKELERSRKKLIKYERRIKRKQTRGSRENENGVSGESGEENGAQNQTSDDQSRRCRISSSSSLNDNSDGTLSDGGDLQHIDHNTPAEDVKSSSGFNENQEQNSLDDSLLDFEDERLSILEQLKVLEEKLHKLAENDQSGSSEIGLNGTTDAKEGSLGMENPEMGSDNSAPFTARDRRAAGVTAKRLLPLFDAASAEPNSANQSQQLARADPSGDWRTISMVVKDNARIAIEEEVCHLYERLHALEADREFLKHTIKSLRKGDEGMKLLQEIAHHLRDLKRIELRAKNFDDDI